jgi:hypothetical protein
MNEQAINPIQSLLNELASIAKSEQTAQTVEQMERTKSLAARLYLELDFAILESQAPSEAELDAWVAQVEQTEEPSLETEVLGSSIIPTESHEENSIENTVNAPVAEPSDSKLEAQGATVEPIEQESEVPVAAEEAEAPELAEIANVPDQVETEAGDVANAVPEIDADAILMSLSMSRRFEFANFLFGGDMARFRLFIEEFVRAGASGSADVFDRWYTECDWRRKDESATDLYRNLKRLV